MKPTHFIATVIIATTILSITSVHAKPALQPEELFAAVDKLQPVIEEVALTVWDQSELSLVEFESSAFLMEVLQKNGFTITSRKTAQVPTAFIAEFGSGKPIIGIMTEYDALPELGTQPTPKRTVREDGITTGHGCGHNLIAAGGVGSALALKNLVEQH